MTREAMRERTIAWYREQLDTMPEDTTFVPADCDQCLIARVQEQLHGFTVSVHGAVMDVDGAVIPLTDDERFIIDAFDDAGTPLTVTGARAFLSDLLPYARRDTDDDAA